MSARNQFQHHDRPARSRPVVLVADPQAGRRRQLARPSPRHEVIEAASLYEAFQMAEEIVPEHLALSADFLADPDMEGVIRLSEMLGSTLFLYAEDGSSPIRSHLSGRARCVVLRRQDSLEDLIDRLSDRQSHLSQAAEDHALPDLVLIGASTGGIAALETVLLTFPADCPPTLVVQHIRDGYVAGLVQRLNQRCRPRVVEATHGLPLLRGTIHFAADSERHLTVSGRTAPRCALVAAPPCHGHRPAVDPLFESGVAWGAQVSAALLTGMGTDGALGLGALRRAGARTIAQDRATSIIWGMPGAAVEAGAAEAVLPIDRIGPALLAGRSQDAAGSMARRSRA